MRGIANGRDQPPTSLVKHVIDESKCGVTKKSRRRNHQPSVGHSMNHKGEWQIRERWYAGATEAKKVLADTHLIFTTLIISHHIYTHHSYRMLASYFIVTELNMAASVTLTPFRHVLCDDHSFWVDFATNKLRVCSHQYHAHRV